MTQSPHTNQWFGHVLMRESVLFVVAGSVVEVLCMLFFVCKALRTDEYKAHWLLTSKCLEHKLWCQKNKQTSIRKNCFAITMIKRTVVAFRY